MRKITVLRHCKSDHPAGLTDHERPLSEKGILDMPRIAKKMTELNIQFDAVFHSSAKRTTLTAQGVTDILNKDAELVESDELYVFDYLSVLEFIYQLDSKYRSVLIVGHNPGLTELINYLTEVQLDNLPTGGFATIEFNVKNWDLIKDQGNLKNIEYPKKWK